MQGAEIVLARNFKSPREQVFAAWTDAGRLAEWWGPNGFTITTESFDMRPGGIWRFMMHGPDGTDYPNVIRYNEIVPPERIVYTHGEDDGSPDAFHVTATFQQAGQGTRLTMHIVFPSADAARRVVEEHGALEGGKQTLGRLAAYLGED
jgi:uncharacterized protein YndB with AHSA1/START domain